MTRDAHRPATRVKARPHRQETTMSDRLDDDLMEDLMDEAEGPAHARHAFDEADEMSEFDEADDEMEDEGDEFSTDEGDSLDEMEEEVADALEADDTDEFFRRLRNIARRVAPVIGRIARTVAPIASAIPLPQAQLIGRAAGLIGRVMADEGDEFDGIDELANLAEEEEDGIDAAAPLVAGLAIRGAMRGAARLPRPVRRQLVRAATTATRQIARRQGPRAAAAALPGVIRQARRVVTRRRLPAQRLPQIVRQTAARVAQSPQLVRRMAQVASRVRSAGGAMPRQRLRGGYTGGGYTSGGYGGSGTAPRVGRAGVGPGYYRGGGGVCPHCARRRTFVMHGPVRLTITPG
jgi:hypothetical protein